MKNKIITILIVLINLPVFSQNKIFGNVGNGVNVNKFTGNFSYEIPILNIPGSNGGYPINLQYNSGIMLEQDGGDIGLGWAITAGGAINRNMVSYPDDYNGEDVITDINCDGCNLVPYFGSSWQAVDAAYGMLMKEFLNKHTDPNFAVQNLHSFGSDARSLAHILQGHLGNQILNMIWKPNVIRSYYPVTKKIEHIYGSLYQSNMPTNASSNQGKSFVSYTDPDVDANDYLLYLQLLLNGNTSLPTSTDNLSLASDIYQKSIDGYLYDNLNPVHMAYDNYYITGSLQGSIKPYRFDNASVSFPLAFNTSNVDQIATYKFKVTPSQSQKVQFRFEGEPTNHYDYHLTASTPEMTITPYNSYYYDALWCDADQGDQWIKSAHYNNQPTSLTSMESTRAGFDASKAKLAQAKYIEWFSNEEFGSTAKAKGLMNYQLSFDRSSSYYPAKGIGGYIIVDENGTTYHYTIPVYNNYRKAVAYELDNEAVQDQMIMGFKYAEKWLLTGITGSDFVDVNNNGIIDDGDTGYYIKFNYGRFHSDFKWRYPYNGSNFTKGDNTKRNYEEGEKEVYYLNSVSTNTHTALFIRDYKKDNKSYYAGDNNKIRNSLKLAEIVLLKNEDYNLLPSYMFNYTNNVILKPSLLSIATNFINSNLIQKISFDQDYSLCSSTPNSFDFLPGSGSITNPNGGKLTLKEILFSGKDNVEQKPSYQFGYNLSNPSYSLNKWDAWGYYKNVASETDNRDANDDGLSWNLTDIISPTGGILSVEYERDDYNNVNGYNITSIKKGDGVRVKSLTVTNDASTNEVYKTNYIYTNDGLTTGITSGVCSSEPEFSRGTEYSFYDNFESPGPFVCYSKVTILPEIVNSGQEIEITEYEFVTPHTNMISSNINVNSGRVEFQSEVAFQSGCPYSNFSKYRYGEAYQKRSYIIENRTSQIGNPLSLKTYTSKRHLIQEITYNYEQSDNEGIVTQACNLVDKTLKYYYMFPDPTTTNLYAHNYSHETRLINTISKFIPTLLTSVETKNKDVVTKMWDSKDFLTGIPFQSDEEIGIAYAYKYINTPAYKKYPALGSKFINENNKNMLNSTCQKYKYNISDNVDNLIETNVSVFSNQANYSVYNPSLNLYETVLNNNQPWRVKENYVWKAHVKSDGSFKTTGSDAFIDYDWGVSASQSVNWKKINDVTLMDKNSNSLESKNIVGKYISSKIDHNSRVITIGNNTKFRDFGFSGAEDVVEIDHVLVNNHFDGEILKGTGSYLNTNFVHTGINSLSVSDGWGFVYRNYSPDVSKKYKASVWVHENNVQEAVLAVAMKSGGISGSTIQYLTTRVDILNTKKAGEWYLLEIDIPSVAENSALSSVNFVEVQTVNFSVGNAAPVYFDDFMVHAVTAPMTSYVYDENTGLVTAIIDNNGMATKYEYDAAGKLIATYKEVLNKGFVKTAEYNYNYAR